jgi:phage FluMu protein Com
MLIRCPYCQTLLFTDAEAGKLYSDVSCFNCKKNGWMSSPPNILMIWNEKTYDDSDQIC